MRVLVLSDLHREVWKERSPAPDLSGCPDVVVLAGDIDNGTRGITWADQAFPDLPVLYVPGNHEAYGQRMDVLEAEFAASCASTEHVHYLHGRALTLGRVRFLGATLWTDFRLFEGIDAPTLYGQLRYGLNDYRRIRVGRGHRKLLPSDTQQWHLHQRRWLAQQLATPHDGPTVVVTHMAPSLRSIDVRHHRDPLTPAYASHLDDLVAQADLWIHGHTHDTNDYRIGLGRVVSNPLGYPRRDGTPENAAFRPGWVVQV